ncbi:MAG: glycoside hydrolase family 5 protein [Clostridiales bacterium]|jgi:hypothetical protein|nr:glycoside hydrolase family 5 protein [Clostridiales bacterium]
MEFIRVYDKKLYCGDEPILLRGFGLGGWLLPEGYMWKLYKSCDRPRRMEKMISDLCGNTYAERFWKSYYESYITEEDIRFIAGQGFNCVRLPINSRHLYKYENEEVIFCEDTVRLIDNCVKWCKNQGIYVILDMHGAPGGQTGQNIDDSENDLPELFTQPQNQKELTELWRKLAKRYAHEAAVAGYDLLNEPLPEWHNKYNDMLIPLYEKLIEAIRLEDKNHIIILEGAHWATDFSIFKNWQPPQGEANLLLQFHKYWSPPDEESLKHFFQARSELSLPLFMGEGGENNTNWYTAVFPLYEKLNISWSFWSYKKMDNTNSPITFPVPDGWDRLINFLEGGESLTEKEAIAVFNSFLHAIGQCQINMDVIRAVKRVPELNIPCEFFDDFGVSGERPAGAILRMDTPVNIQFSNGNNVIPDYNRYGGEAQKDEENLVVILNETDWVSYNFNAESQGMYFISVDTLKKGRLRVECGGSTQAFEVDGNCELKTSSLLLTPGKHSVKLLCECGTIALDNVYIRNAKV